MTEDQISGVHVSRGSAETLARGGGITNHRLIVYLLSNISAKNYQHQLICVEVIVCYIIVDFLRDSVDILSATVTDKETRDLALASMARDDAPASSTASSTPQCAVKWDRNLKPKLAIMRQCTSVTTDRQTDTGIIA